jgi:hypothetical protein
VLIGAPVGRRGDDCVEDSQTPSHCVASTTKTPFLVLLHPTSNTKARIGCPHTLTFPSRTSGTTAKLTKHRHRPTRLQVTEAASVPSPMQKHNQAHATNHIYDEVTTPNPPDTQSEIGLTFRNKTNPQTRPAPRNLNAPTDRATPDKAHGCVVRTFHNVDLRSVSNSTHECTIDKRIKERIPIACCFCGWN